MGILELYVPVFKQKTQGRIQRLCWQGGGGSIMEQYFQ